MTSVRDNAHTIVDFELITANQMAGKIFGKDITNISGKRFADEFNWIQDISIKQLADVVETGREYAFEFYDNNRTTWFDIGISKMTDGVVVTFTDITQKKVSSDLLKKSFDDLKITSTQLAFSNEKLEQSNLDLMQFASIASHDLKEPLRKIQAFGNILQTRVANKLDEEDRNYFQRIIKASNRMQTLIEDVLTLSKLSNNELSYEKVDLNATIAQILDDIEISIREKNAIVNVEELPMIEAVPGQMHQLFQNLISNALKFNENKQPCISITMQEVGQILNGRKNQFTCIRVQDNGIGFDEEFKEKIFGIFQRLNGQKYTGSGIGLAICKKIVENHKGYIQPQSEIDRGSYFDIILPLKRVGENSRVAV
jgi:two-component system CheB/CheR fusion protein